MNIDSAKFTKAVEDSGIKIVRLATVSGLTKARIYQLMWNGGNTNDLSAKALAKALKVSLDTIRGEG